MPHADVVIVGAGVVGCSLALELAAGGLRVVAIDRGPAGREASWAAAGMLAPASEFRGQDALGGLAGSSAALYPGWVARLRELSGIDPGYRAEGTLLVACTESEVSAFLPGGESLSTQAARRLEPALAEGIVAARFLPDDHQVDNRRLMSALVAAAAGAGVEFRAGNTVAGLVEEGEQVLGVRLADGSSVLGGAVVNAAGCWAGTWAAANARVAPTRPVRGQMIAVRSESTLVRHVVRSPRAYVVPRADGRLILGSTMEDAGFDKSTTPEGLGSIFAGAREILPSLAGLPFEETWAGLRPDTPDHLPILGATDRENYFVATGHFRNGILLAPITARVLAGLLLGRPPAVSLEAFSPLRFLRRDAARMTRP